MTAVEWLEMQYHKKGYALSSNDFQEAKQMEKEQIVKAAAVVLWHNSANSTKEAEQYYNEAYNKP